MYNLTNNSAKTPYSIPPKYATFAPKTNKYGRVDRSKFND